MSLVVRKLFKNYAGRVNAVEVLHDLSFDLDAGGSAAITGPSGAGKSTLLHILGTLDFPDAGEVLINGSNPFELDEEKLALFRNRDIGFVFQEHYLLPQYSVLENVTIPAYAYSIEDDAEDRARTLIEKVGLAHRVDHRPAELSGGERQRVAIARALVNRPGLVLCDEPTGNLDSKTADQVTSLLLDLHVEERNMLMVVTHNDALAKRFKIQMDLRDGRFNGST